MVSVISFESWTGKHNVGVVYEDFDDVDNKVDDEYDKYFGQCKCEKYTQKYLSHKTTKVTIKQ